MTTDAELKAAIENVSAMTDDEFFEAAERCALDPLSGGMRRPGGYVAPSARPAAQRLAYTVDEAAEASTLGKTTVKKLIATGELRSTLVGGRRLVPIDALFELINGGPS